MADQGQRRSSHENEDAASMTGWEAWILNVVGEKMSLNFDSEFSKICRPSRTSPVWRLLQLTLELLNDKHQDCNHVGVE